MRREQTAPELKQFQDRETLHEHLANALQLLSAARAHGDMLDEGLASALRNRIELAYDETLALRKIAAESNAVMTQAHARLRL
jgi:hypothetical protein